MIKNIILDWSGTVVDDLDAVIKATNSVLKDFGRPKVTKEEYRQEFALPFRTFYERFLPGVPLTQIDTVYHRFFTLYRDQINLFPGVAEFFAFSTTTGRRLFVLGCAPRNPTILHTRLCWGNGQNESHPFASRRK